MLCLALREVPSILLGQTCKCYFNVICLHRQCTTTKSVKQIICECHFLRVQFLELNCELQLSLQVVSNASFFPRSFFFLCVYDESNLFIV